MKNFSRYNVPKDEAYEPNSNNLVLKNFLGIKSKEIMEELEENRHIKQIDKFFWLFYL
jgi:hypothetical protein